MPPSARMMTSKLDSLSETQTFAGVAFGLGLSVVHQILFYVRSLFLFTCGINPRMMWDFAERATLWVQDDG